MLVRLCFVRSTVVFHFFFHFLRANPQDAVKNLQTALAPSIDTALSTNAIPAANKVTSSISQTPVFASLTMV